VSAGGADVDEDALGCPAEQSYHRTEEFAEKASKSKMALMNSDKSRHPFE
jgi:hypothetical protein